MSLFSRMLILVLLIGGMGCATFSSRPAKMDVDRRPQRQIVWRPVSEGVLKVMKSQGDPAWRNDPGAVVELASDKCIIYSPEPKKFDDFFEVWQLGDGIERCYRQTRDPLTLAEIKSALAKEVAVHHDWKGREVRPEYRLYTVSLTPVLLPKEEVAEFAALLHPQLDELRDYYRLYGLALPDTSQRPVDCVVLAPRPESNKDSLATTVLGHELLHCFLGAWHPMDVRDQAEFGVLPSQPEIKEVRKNLEELLKEKRP